VLPPLSWLPVDEEIIEAQDRTASDLARVGLKVEIAQPEGFGDFCHFYELYELILSAITSASVPTLTRYLHALVYWLLRGDFYTARARGLLANASDYIAWFAQRERYRAAYRAFFSQWDILLTPVNIVNAFPHTDLPFYRRRLDVNEQKVRYLLQNVYPGFATLCGLPAVAFPAGVTRAGLPIGLQAIGPYLEDRTALRFVMLLAQEFGGFRRPCGYGLM
jgi:amidase